MPKYNNSNSKKKSIKKNIPKKKVKQTNSRKKNKDISNPKKDSGSKKDIKNKVQKGGSDSCTKPSQPLRPRLYNKAQSSNILEDYPNAPPFPPDFLDDCVIM